MVTRVDKKPIIYNTCLLRAIKPAVVSKSKATLNSILKKAKGYRVPSINTRELLDDYDDIEHAFKIFGIDDPSYVIFGNLPEDEEDEVIRLARVCLEKHKTVRQLLRNEALCESMCKIQSLIIDKAEKIYFGTEAVYKVFEKVLLGDVFETNLVPNYAKWCSDTSHQILLLQSTYMFLHPSATDKMAGEISRDMNYRVWHAWDIFKKTETACIRIGSRKNMLAHSYYSGINKRGFTPDKDVASDFELPMTGYCKVKPSVKVYMILGMRYFVMGDSVFVLSHDDCINLASMAQCYFRVAMYFTKSNGYPMETTDKATHLLRDIVVHCCKLIDVGKNFSHIIRSMHILSQGEFNDAFEEDFALDLGWRDRSANYKAEAHSLDPMGAIFHSRAVGLAVDRIDRLNTCFIYHAFIGDEMLVDDLRDKVMNMTAKVKPADTATWSDFINFVKSYTLCRFMLVNKKKPKCGGNLSLLNSRWAEKCVAGMFSMPPHNEWGEVWIQGEYRYTQFADVWHLEAQDVAYVVKDSQGIVQSKYVQDRKIHSELLMAMTSGNVLDTLTGSTPRSARERIVNGGEVKEVVITTAPKAENAKPSWKKRVTFAADCEFRKMQAEFDRNCRRVMSFVRGPSLGVDQCILEKQFSEIADASATGNRGAICSHDISAWSESMDRKRKFEFEEVLIRMFDKPEMINIKNDWQKINAVVNKQGAKNIYKIDNSSFQGFDGSASTIMHSMILIYCIDSARRANVMPDDVKANMATLIDDCIALMLNLTREKDAKGFWAHLKATYLKLGFEVDDLKSIFSTIKAIYLSRRFLLGGEVPADLKVFMKAHSSYEDPLRCTLDVPGDIFGAMRGACDANGEAWYIYYCACISSLAELAHQNNVILKIPPSAAAAFALAPVVENGWGFPSIVAWSTNDVTDKRGHFNAIMELNAVHMCQDERFIAGVNVFPRPVAKALCAIKSQPWRMVSLSNIFTNPFEAIREGPLKPDMLRRNAVSDMLEEVAVAEPWRSLLKWNRSSTTIRVRELLVSSGPLHAPTLSALVNCMPDNYRLGLVGKAIGSESLLSLLSGAAKVVLKRRVHRCSQSYFKYTRALYDSSNMVLSHQDVASLTYIEKTRMEREEFYAANGVTMIDHTFPDPVATFTTSAVRTGSVISPNHASLRIWDKTKNRAHRTSHLISDRGLYVPRRSGRVWEVTCEYARGWDSVSQRVAMGLAIIARARADGHKTSGLLTYFIKSWNELSNITPDDTHLIQIHGSTKRLDANPGSSTHPIIVNRNILRGFNNNLKSAKDAIPIECSKLTGNDSTLHDMLAHDTAMTCVTALIYECFQFIGVSDAATEYNMSARIGCIIPESELRMDTDSVADQILIEIMDGADDYGLLQACPELIVEIAIPTMKSSWVQMINALMDKDPSKVEELRMNAARHSIDELTEMMKADEVHYSPSVILAAEPARRRTVPIHEVRSLSIRPQGESARATGDMYTVGVSTVGSKFSRALTEHQPDHVTAAVAVRSILWDRLKSKSAVQLAKILYMDPDVDTSIIKVCATSDFWRAVVVEINKNAKKVTTSELTMSAFRSLGVPDLHINSSDDLAAITHSVASFFGAHLQLAVVPIADLINHLAGRSSKHYDRPLSERVVTNNPSLMNAKLRKEHITKLIACNIENYKDRVDKLLEGKPMHRGDKRCSEHSKHARIVELRCRMYVYMSAVVDDMGRATISYVKLGEIIENASKRIWEKLKLSDETRPSVVWKQDASVGDVLKFMYEVDDKLYVMRDQYKGNSGWDAASGEVGTKLAIQTLSMDANVAMDTKFAISASEVAPRLHKKVIITEYAAPVAKDRNPVAYVVDDVFAGEGGMSLDEMADMDFEDMFFSAPTTLPIAYWKAVYALLLTGHYSGDKVNKALGTNMPSSSSVNIAALREAHLEDFSDDAIKLKLPSIVGDYMASGIVFDETWLDRDEAEAYTTDEMITLKGGFLF